MPFAEPPAIEDQVVTGDVDERLVLSLWWQEAGGRLSRAELAATRLQVEVEEAA